MEELESRKEDNQQVLKVLEALKQASLDLQTNPSSLTSSNSPSSPIKALLELETESDNILSNDPHLCKLSHHISSLKSLITKLEQFQRKYSLRSFFHRRVNSHEITKVASSIQSEIQSWIDRETVENLVKSLNTTISEDEKIKLISSFEDRISEGFNRDLQDSILKAKVFTVLESVLCDTKCSKTIRERSGFAIRALVKFNKDVFVGEVLMGSTIRSLVSMGSYSSIKILCSLIRLIKSPLVDEIEIPKIKTFLNSEDLLIKVAALDCLLDIGYFGRKDTIQAMFDEGLVEKLVELQRSELGGDLIDMGNFEEENLRHGVDCKEMGKKEESRERRFLERKPFSSCVARFAIQLEVGEGLRQRERRGYKQEVLKCVRKACIDDAEASAILAEVLWGSSP